jgi:ribose transport system ATP-binding protein
MSVIVLELRGITKRFAGVAALQDVNLTLRRGQILAVVGENGAGKSTLMKILSGVHRPDAGIIHLDGCDIELKNPQDAQARGIGIIYQEFSLVPYLNVVENLFLGRERKTRFGACATREMQREARAVLDRLGASLPLRSPVARLSVAERQFVEIAKALLRRTRILILDEPTAPLTPPEVARLFAVMRELKRDGVALIFISHHLEEIFAIADDLVCLRDGRVVGARPVADCSKGELIKLMVGRDVVHTYPPKPSPPSSPKVLLDVRLQRKPHSPEIVFNVRCGEILGIAGLVGAGRTKMIRALVGADRAAQRDLRLDGRPLHVASPADARAAGIGLVPEDRAHQGLVLDASVADNILLADLRQACHATWHFLRRRAAGEIARHFVEVLRIKIRSLHQAVRTLSGGNQQKVVLAKWLHTGCRVLIFDEPTRGIDIAAKTEIYQLMRELTARGFAIVMVSSELAEVLGMSDRVIVMRAQRIARLFDAGEPVTVEDILIPAAGGCHD